jgi:glutaredoxin
MPADARSDHAIARPTEPEARLMTAEPARVTVVTASACHFCEDAQETLADLAHKYPLTVQLFAAASESGRVVLGRYGSGMFPLVLVDGEFFSAGRLPRRKLTRLLAARTAASAGAA